MGHNLRGSNLSEMSIERVKLYLGLIAYITLWVTLQQLVPIFFFIRAATCSKSGQQVKIVFLELI